MGDIRLLALPDYMADERVPFHLVDGWRERSRSSGGFEQFMGIGVHHTASRTTPERDKDFCIFESPNRPIGNGCIMRDGVFWFWAAGATNTNGRGLARFTQRGVMPADTANTRAAGIEAANNGIGESWTPQMVDTYPRLCAAMLRCGTETTPGVPMGPGDVFGHREHAPDRKFDPAGPGAPWSTSTLNVHGANVWDMDAFRGAVFQALLPPAPPEPPAPQPPGDDDMIDKLYRFAGDGKDARVYVRYTNGTKQWVTGVPMQKAVALILAANGRPTEVEVVDSVPMWRALGVLVGPKPRGVDAHGMNIPVKAATAAKR